LTGQRSSSGCRKDWAFGLAEDRLSRQAPGKSKPRPTAALVPQAGAGQGLTLLSNCDNCCMKWTRAAPSNPRGQWGLGEACRILVQWDGAFASVVLHFDIVHTVFSVRYVCTRCDLQILSQYGAHLSAYVPKPSTSFTLEISKGENIKALPQALWYC
jgi:hypothetical protein